MTYTYTHIFYDIPIYTSVHSYTHTHTIGTHVWEGGCASSYTNYQSGEPNNGANGGVAGSEHYITMINVSTYVPICTYFILNPLSLYGI
jgi:hypothetical protein